ncbi:MAG: YHS domain-containing protein [Pseudomonadota bacterium]
MGIGSLLRWAIIALVVWLLYRMVKRMFAGQLGGGARRAENLRPRGDEDVLDVMVQDPQCGTYLPQHEALRTMIQGRERYFCSEACRDAFLRAVKENN